MMESDPLKECQELLRSPSANSTSETYTDCQDFVFKGNFRITEKDWKTHEERSYYFASWKLALMAFDYRLEDQAAVSQNLTKNFGPAVSENRWQGPDRASLLFHPLEDDDKKVRLVVGFLKQ
jgi:hypothetical protein